MLIKCKLRLCLITRVRSTEQLGGILAPRGPLGDGEQRDGEMQPAHALSFHSLAWGSWEAWLAGALHVELFLSAEMPFCLFI